MAAKTGLRAVVAALYDLKYGTIWSKEARVGPWANEDIRMFFSEVGVSWPRSELERLDLIRRLELLQVYLDGGSAPG